MMKPRPIRYKVTVHNLFVDTIYEVGLREKINKLAGKKPDHYYETGTYKSHAQIEFIYDSKRKALSVAKKLYNLTLDSISLSKT